MHCPAQKAGDSRAASNAQNYLQKVTEPLLETSLISTSTGSPVLIRLTCTCSSLTVNVLEDGEGTHFTGYTEQRWSSGDFDGVGRYVAGGAAVTAEVGPLAAAVFHQETRSTGVNDLGEYSPLAINRSAGIDGLTQEHAIQWIGSDRGGQNMTKREEGQQPKQGGHQRTLPFQREDSVIFDYLLARDYTPKNREQNHGIWKLRWNDRAE